MSGDGFLARWSRRKRGVEADAPEQAPETPLVEKAAVAPAPEGDELQALIDSLPRLEDLTAESSLAPFMQAWVPQPLRNAAMRRMWVLDPVIRDHRPPVDLDWDFNTPGAISGFGDLAPGLDPLEGLPKLSEWVKDVATLPADSEAGAAPPVEALAPPVDDAETRPDEPSNTEAAPAEPAPPAKPRRRLGGATPV